MRSATYDVVIVGSGLAGMTVARSLPDQYRILIIAKTDVTRSSSWRAQGGVAAAFHQDDHWTAHKDDTLKAGRGHGHEVHIDMLTREAQAAIRFLQEKGVSFATELHQEGGHQRRRIHHIQGDQTGVAMMSTLCAGLPTNIDYVADEMVAELLLSEEGVCCGVKTVTSHGHSREYMSQFTVLGTGGCADLFAHSSNSGDSIGSGIALACKAGATLTDLEFIQFHPTLLTIKDISIGLISEAVRGEGARLVNQYGDAVMAGYHPLGDLAPRDVVSRAIHHKLSLGESIYLDINDVPNFADRFPGIAGMCKANGLSIEQGLLPVKPGAHYMMGGIAASMDGATSVPRLFAVGEVACTGVHGANRLASNSLLEAVICGRKTAQRIVSYTADSTLTSIHRQQDNGVGREQEWLDIQSVKNEMTSVCGILREGAALEQLYKRLAPYSETALQCDWSQGSQAHIAQWHRIVASTCIVKAAFMRKESRGSHFRLDYPHEEPAWEKKHIFINRRSVWEGDFTNANHSLTTNA
ncbi:L-aspartate oxidase [Bacillaceae bacterium SIJ1]|uniref:L-aspartate oxidase n=1 Tax=Litoribacterium kuwaitense TaxID=1398745 RepID=UPI0013EDD891|nr:L-aspartate oxidase [Litoribacterium kuwaitense]NGP46901.1 L-aspartate oxidase [Litoribacterium kuwaitense]